MSGSRQRLQGCSRRHHRWHLAHTLTVIRQRMREGGQLIIAVEPPNGDGGLRIQAVRTEDGRNWWTVFTGFDEELKGSDSVKSTFLTDMRQVFSKAVPDRGDRGDYIKSVEQNADVR